MITLSRLWPRAEVRRLQEELKSEKQATRFHMDAANSMQVKLDAALAEANQARKESIDTLKRMINVQMLAAGSRGVMFEDVGPQASPRMVANDEQLKPAGIKMRAGQAARMQRTNYVKEFMDQQFGLNPSEPQPYTDDEPPADDPAQNEATG
jgi:hypothetical protein